MACTPPVTRSAGYLFIDYIHTTRNLPHRSHLRLNTTADPLDPITMLTEANTLSGVMANALSSNLTIVGWGTQDINGVGLLQIAFSSPIPGNHTAAGGAEDYQARTVAFTGRGVPGTAVSCKGPTVLRLFVADTYNFTPGQKFISAGVDAGLDDLALELSTNSVFWFDFYGQKATVRTTYPTHFHAYIQDRFGQ